jgi:hypothetical protein
MSTSKRERLGPSHVRSGVLLDVHGIRAYLGPFNELAEFLPCICVDRHPLRVAIEGTEFVLYMWVFDQWDEFGRQIVPYRLSTVLQLIAAYDWLQELDYDEATAWDV